MLRVFELGTKAKEISLEEVSLRTRKKYWVDCVHLTKVEANAVAEKFDLHPLTTEDIQNTRVRVKVEEFPGHLYAVFYGIQGHPVKIDFLLGKNFLVTNHAEELAVTKLLKTEPERIEKNLGKGPDFLMHRIFDAEVDRCFTELDEKGHAIDVLEEKAASNPDKSVLSEIYSLKRELSQLKRIFIAQREKSGWFAKSGHHFVSAAAVPYFRDVYDHSIHVSDAIDNYRETIANAYDVYMSAMSNNMNEIMKTLSVIATIALPLSVISGIYGTNFTNLPGQGVASGFWLMLLGMAGLCVVMLLYFWRKKWF